MLQRWNSITETHYQREEVSPDGYQRKKTAAYSDKDPGG